MKKPLFAAVSISFILYILTHPIEAVNGSTAGLLLWFQVIIPTLLPFIILSNIMLQIDGVHYCTHLFYPIFSKIFKVSPNGTYAILTGFLFGYPMGAKVTADLLENHFISRTEAKHLLSFCNNVSPAFLINFIVIACLNDKKILIPTLVILYGSSLLCGFIFRFVYKDKEKHCIIKNTTSRSQINFKIVDVSIMNGFETITKLGGYMILFAILVEIVKNIPLTNNFFQCVFIGLLEITNGIQFISTSSISVETKYALIMGITAFGGLSCIAQTASMIKSVNLSILPYIYGKLLHSILAVLFTLTYLLLIQP